jgi:tRNA-specific 2-thiouridylase
MPMSGLAEDITFVSGTLPKAAVDVLAKIRYRSDAVPATLIPGLDRTAEVHFQKPQRAVTPGQAVVFFEGDRVLGGGTISARLD